MTNATLLRMVRASVERRLGRALDEGAGKGHMLQALYEAEGAAAVVEVGRGIRDLEAHPVLDAVVSPSEPRLVLERWMRLERFGHTRNRTRVLESSAAQRWASVVHYAEDGATIEPLNDLFVWGLLIGLLERAGVGGVTVELTQASGGPVQLHPPRGSAQPGTVPERSATAVFRWGTHRADRHPRGFAGAPESQFRERLRALVHSDLVRTWKLADAARSLGVSTRRLQRSLRAEGTTFGELVQRVRVDAAGTLIPQARLSLVDVAFCTGFADAAHFSRVFRRHLDVPPSAFRDIVVERGGDPSASKLV